MKFPAPDQAPDVNVEAVDGGDLLNHLDFSLERRWVKRNVWETANGRIDSRRFMRFRVEGRRVYRNFGVGTFPENTKGHTEDVVLIGQGNV